MGVRLLRQGLTEPIAIFFSTSAKAHVRNNSKVRLRRVAVFAMQGQHGTWQLAGARLGHPLIVKSPTPDSFSVGPLLLPVAHQHPSRPMSTFYILCAVVIRALLVERRQYSRALTARGCTVHIWGITGASREGGCK